MIFHFRPSWFWFAKVQEGSSNSVLNKWYTQLVAISRMMTSAVASPLLWLRAPQVRLPGKLPESPDGASSPSHRGF